MIKNNQHGFSLIESLLVIVIISSIVFLLANIPNAISLINKSKHMSLAREIAVKQIEDKRNIKYNDLTNGTSSINDSRLNLLPQGTGTIIIEACNPPLCANNELIKQATISINWKDNNRLQTIILKTLISKGGLNK